MTASAHAIASDAYTELVGEVSALARADAAAGADYDTAYHQRWESTLRRMMREDPKRWGQVRRAAAAHVTYKPDPTLTRRERREQRREMRMRGR